MSEPQRKDYAHLFFRSPRNGNTDTNPLLDTDDEDTLCRSMRTRKSLLDVVGPYRGPTWQWGEGQDSQTGMLASTWAMRESSSTDVDTPSNWAVKGLPPKELLVTRSKYSPKVDERVEVLAEGLRKMPVSCPIGSLDPFQSFSNSKSKSLRRARGRLQHHSKDRHSKCPEPSKLSTIPSVKHNGVSCSIGWLPEEDIAELSTFTDVDTWTNRIWFVQHKPGSPFGCPQTHGSAPFWESCDTRNLSSKSRTFVLKISGPLQQPAAWGETRKRCVALQDQPQDMPSSGLDTRMENAHSCTTVSAPVEEYFGANRGAPFAPPPNMSKARNTLISIPEVQVINVQQTDTTSSATGCVQTQENPSSTLPSPPGTEANSPAAQTLPRSSLVPPPSNASSRRSSTDESLPDATDSDISYGTDSEPESDIEDLRAAAGQSPGSDGSYVVVDHDNQSGMRTHGTHGNGDSSASSGSGGHFHPYQDRNVGSSERTGRRRSAGGGDEDDKGRKRPRRNDERRGSGSADNSGRRLACPYYRFDPKNPEHMRCKDKSWPTLARVKGHVLRSHLRPLQCERCCKFRAGDRGQISNHLKGGNCEKAEFVPMDPEVERKGNDLSRGASRTWAQVCMVLFDCDLASVPPAYVDDELSAPNKSPSTSSPVPKISDDPLEAIFQSPSFQGFVQQNLVAVLGEVLPNILAQQMPLLISRYRETQQSPSAQSNQEIHSSRTAVSASPMPAGQSFVDQSIRNPEPSVLLSPPHIPGGSTPMTTHDSFDPQVAFLNPFGNTSADFDALTYDFGGIPPDMASFENGGMEIDEELVSSFDAFRGDEFMDKMR